MIIDKQLPSIPKKLKANDDTDRAVIQPVYILLLKLVGKNNSVGFFSIFPSTHNHCIVAYLSNIFRDKMRLRKDFFRVWLIWNSHCTKDEVFHYELLQ